MNHDQIQPLLVLSAAGLLGAAGERSVLEHARECPVCAAQLETLSAVSSALSSRPAPAPPPDLLLRTQARVSAELALMAERRRSVWIAAGAAAFAWVINLATWAVVHWWRPDLPALATWLALSALSAALAAPVAMAARRRMERRIS
jgi:CHASE2 domain-containing sensor protein